MQSLILRQLRRRLWNRNKIGQHCFFSLKDLYSYLNSTIRILMLDITKLPTTNQELLELGAREAPVRFEASEAEYWALLQRAAYKAEYAKGEIVATMGYENALHSFIATRLSYLLQTIFSDLNAYRISNSNRPVCIEACDNAIFIPDGSVLQMPLDPYEFQPGMDAERTPLLLFEVLSPSTRIRDFGEKLPCYKQIPSLQHILYLETDNVKVFHSHRREDGLWVEGIYTDKSDKIVLPYGTVTLGELYVE